MDTELHRHIRTHMLELHSLSHFGRISEICRGLGGVRELIHGMPSYGSVNGFEIDARYARFYRRVGDDTAHCGAILGDIAHISLDQLADSEGFPVIFSFIVI